MRERYESRTPPRAEPTDAPTHATSPNAVASPNRDGTPAHAPTPTAIADPQERLRTAFTAIANTRAAEANYQHAKQRAADEAYNREVAAQRQAVEAQMREVRERWHPTLTELRTALEQARLEAYLRAGEAGLNLRGGAYIGLDDAEPSAHDAPRTAQPSPPAPTTRLPDIRAATPLPAPDAGDARTL